jgi:hypothetical protein
MEAAIPYETRVQRAIRSTPLPILSLSGMVWTVHQPGGSLLKTTSVIEIRRDIC